MMRLLGISILVAVGAVFVGSLITATPEGMATALILGVIGGLIATAIVIGITFVSRK